MALGQSIIFQPILRMRYLLTICFSLVILSHQTTSRIKVCKMINVINLFFVTVDTDS